MVLTLLGSTVCVHLPAQALEESSLPQVVASLLVLPRGDSVSSLSATMRRPIRAVLLGHMEAETRGKHGALQGEHYLINIITK